VMLPRGWQFQRVRQARGLTSAGSVRVSSLVSFVRSKARGPSWPLSSRGAAELHGYGYLGEGFLERERIKRMQARWRRRLAVMPALERYALLSAIRSSAPH